MTRADDLNHAVDTIVFKVLSGEYRIEDVRAMLESALAYAAANACKEADAAVCFNCAHKPQIECENKHSPHYETVCRLGQSCDDWEARDRIAEAEELAQIVPLPPASLGKICFNCTNKPRLVCVAFQSPYRGYTVGSVGTCNEWQGGVS